MFKSLVVAASVALAVNAQSTTSTSDGAVPSGLTPCIIDCSSQAADAAGCSSYTDLSCVCTSTAFQTAASACLQANCTPADIQTAQQLQSAECASISSSTTSSDSLTLSGSATLGTPSTTVSLSTTVTPSTSSAPIINTSSSTSTAPITSSASHASSSSSTSHTSSTSTTSSAATSSGAATGLVSSLTLNGAFGALVALAGSLVGAVLIL